MDKKTVDYIGIIELYSYDVKMQCMGKGGKKGRKDSAFHLISSTISAAAIAAYLY